MAAENSALGGGATDRTPPRKSVVDLGVDSLKLIDLQIQLLQLDLGEFWSRARLAIGVLALSSAALIAAIPVALFGAAEYLRLAINVSLETALLLVAGVVGGLALAAGVWSVRKLGNAANPLKRSRDELQANLVWLRQILHADDQ